MGRRFPAVCHSRGAAARPLDLSARQVKSHLQKYRIRVVAEKGSEHATEAQVGAGSAALRHASLVGMQWHVACCSDLPSVAFFAEAAIPQLAAGGPT